MPTKHPRINVTKDAELAAATIVHNLAIRGAAALAGDVARRRESIEVVALTTDPDSDLDRETLLHVRRTAWRT